MGRLAVGAIGVVFGDIGTSPLYAFQEVFAGPRNLDVQPDRAMGAVSMIFWTLTLVVSVKYVLIVMRADNGGEGGIMALTAYIHRLKISAKSLALLSALGVFGAALFYGDGMITPAVSVLSAIEGIEVVAPSLSSYVEIVAVVILLLLFASQRYGTARVGAAFGPVMIVWFAVIAALGIASIVQTPGVLKAISPTYAVGLAISEPLVAFVSLGSVVLCVTGAEALYADMGHFGKRPIRLSWFWIVMPALFCNYLGQAALIIRTPSADGNPFYLLVPHVLMWPMIILATMATVIASQAVISGAFSMTDEAIRLGYLPRMRVRHTSAAHRGQIYVPFVNWALCLAVVVLILGFRDSSNLASAYGIAVTGTFVITTILITAVARKQWGAPLWAVIPLAGLFGFIDLSFFGANLLKFFHGGWFPLAVAIVLFTVFMSWAAGLRLLRARMAAETLDVAELEGYVAAHHVPVIPGTAIFLTGGSKLPMALGEYLRKGGNLRANTVQAAFLVQQVPTVPLDEQLRFVELGPHLTRLEVRYGFMEYPSGKALIAALRAHGIPVAEGNSMIIIHTVDPLPVDSKGMALWRKHIFAFLMRNARQPQLVLTVPQDMIMEWTTLMRF